MGVQIRWFGRRLLGVVLQDPTLPSRLQQSPSGWISARAELVPSNTRDHSISVRTSAVLTVAPLRSSRTAL